MHRSGWRGGDDGVDLLAARDAHRRRDRRQVPAHVLVRDEQPPREQPRLAGGTLEPERAVQLVRRAAAPRTEVARTVHPGLGRRDEILVAVHPLRVVRREHVRLDPESRQVLGELERPLDAAPARGREVHRDEQDLHAGLSR